MHQHIFLTSKKDEDWQSILFRELKTLERGFLEIDCGDNFLNSKDITYINKQCMRKGLILTTIKSYVPETIVSAAALGFISVLNMKYEMQQTAKDQSFLLNTEKEENIFFHQGTLRSGEILEANSDLLIHGDVNPGAIVSAGGDVMIWGRLLGIAHAGRFGNDHSKITALQLRPVQLRISNKIARGPKERPEEGLAEEAVIENGIIVIKPAKST
ncbi:septum site-determining protein MinC [Prochlorococcus marinus]|uniref:Possible septum site-determining protein n=1 Tax=Prochlorococcus marinus (strain MIT 9211) TaxID=93059 RepID=A9BDX9_PROM4|nr:septum site-determining protein MinC [Prochlorococcus marinus]ABX08289.1 possible septum site-determining protein [Prochlorococcus marinus str. MIT 9211]